MAPGPITVPNFPPSVRRAGRGAAGGPWPAPCQACCPFCTDNTPLVQTEFRAGKQLVRTVFVRTSYGLHIRHIRRRGRFRAAKFLKDRPSRCCSVQGVTSRPSSAETSLPLPSARLPAPPVRCPVRSGPGLVKHGAAVLVEFLPEPGKLTAALRLHPMLACSEPASQPVPASGHDLPLNRLLPLVTTLLRVPMRYCH